mgnify:CR=1 FL=1
MTIEQLWPMICRTTADGTRGTGFLVGKQKVLTCAHCLGSEESSVKSVELYFSRWSEEKRKVRAQVIKVDWENDVALLQPDVLVEEWLPLAKAKERDEWCLLGHPSQVGSDGVVICGKIIDISARAFDKSVLQLETPPARDFDRVQGASGSPIVVDGHVVGMLTRQLLGRGEEGIRPVFDVLYALPVDWLAQLLGISIDTPGTPPIAQPVIAQPVNEGELSRRLQLELKMSRQEYELKLQVIEAINDSILTCLDPSKMPILKLQLEKAEKEIKQIEDKIESILSGKKR